MAESLKHQSWPVITDADKQAVLDVLERGILSGPLAPEVTSLEREFAAYLGVKYCLSANSGTAALHMGLEAIGIGPGDEVIVPAFTFVASAMAVLQQGATPVFVDIELGSLGLDPACVKRAITPKTRAIMPVHMHGMPCDIDAIFAIARQHDLMVIEDACQAHGATYHGQKVGSFGKVAAFSLQSSKNLAAGEGGLFVTNDETCYQRAARFRMFGENIQMSDTSVFDPSRPLDLKRSYDSVSIGYMYRMPELTAALARTQLKRLDFWNERARTNAAILNAGLIGLNAIEPPGEIVGRTSVYHKYRVRAKQRDQVMGLLSQHGLEAVQWQSKTVPEQTLFQKLGFDGSAFPNARKLLNESFCLFSHSHPLWVQSEQLCQHYLKVIQSLLS
ncbi:MAG: DegT/DnrJ/EryC1/StrS family aminotransferase [Myxococcota bacterium]